MKSDFSKRLHGVIPGGAHTYSRGDDQFPSNAPPILEKGKGAYVYDPDGVEYLDYGMGLRSVNIGYGNEEIAEAAYKELLNGNNLTRASVVELEAAELLRQVIPSVEMVKFAKHGSTVTTAAVKLARAYTGRKYVAIPAEQPFFSFDDWFIGSTEMDKGVTSEVKAHTLRFHYNDIESLETLFENYPGQIACVIMEAATALDPCKNSCFKGQVCTECPNNEGNFLKRVVSLVHKNSAVFILDEMITGFRWHLQGAQKFYGIEPDLTTFGKAMANGFAVAALGGKKEIMKMGSILETGKERVFLTSTTHGAEMGSLAAFIKTYEILKREDVIKHIWEYGEKLMKGMNEISKSMGILDYFFVNGYPCSPNYVTKDLEGNISLEMRTLFAQEMIRNNIMMPYIAISFAHGEKELTKTLSAVQSSLEVYQKGLQSKEYLHSPIIKPVFRKYN